MFKLFCKLSVFLCITISFNGFSQSSENNTGVKNSGHSKQGIQKTKNYNPVLIANLSPVIKETSGLVYFKGQLWTINDSENLAEIYQVDTLTGNVLRTVVVSNAINSDWESITMDDSNVYIGDFGNNFGDRTNLQILKISNSFIFNSSIDTVQAGYINFNFSDQSAVSTTIQKTNFDYEAFIYYNDSLHLFSKDWTDHQTRHYVLPADTGIHQAMYVEQFDADGLITDAAVNQKGDIVLLGYKNTGGQFYTCFSWILSGYKSYYFFSGEKRRIKLGSALHLGQTEGLAFKNDFELFLSAESIRIAGSQFSAKLFSLNFKKFLDAKH
jgi:hypothetical protein